LRENTIASRKARKVRKGKPKADTTGSNPFAFASFLRVSASLR